MRTEQRDQLRSALYERGIETGITTRPRYQQAHGWMNRPVGSFLNAERFARTVLSLPMYPSLSEQLVEHMCDVCESVLSEH